MAMDRRLLGLLLGGISLLGVAPWAVAQKPARHTKADVAFLQGMIRHHGQALEMSVLVPSRSKTGPLNSLAERIIVSQRDEIRLMRSWLDGVGERAPDEDGHHVHDDQLAMSGMLTAAEMAALEAATGPAFERLFLRSMIRHHEGAIAMVATLFATPGAGQDPDIYRMAADVEADQRAEIARMRALLQPLERS